MCLNFRDMLEKHEREEAESRKKVQHKDERKIARERQRAENVAKKQRENEARATR